jgi:hexosaminidase
MKSLHTLCLAVMFCFSAGSSNAQTHTAVPVIPKPDSLVMLEGTFRLNDKTVIEVNQKLLPKAEQLRRYLSPATGYPLPVSRNIGTGNSIQLRLTNGPASLGNEGYALHITPEHVLITARNETGILWGIQTVRQLFPRDILHESKVDGMEWSLPCLRIVDTPRFSWRGLMIDFSRTFWNVSVAKKYIDALSFYKMNKLHMHLTDDQGWRLEINKYPRLTSVASRFDTVYHEPPEHEGFFTKADIRELVRYAKERNVELIPEIEMPGHSLAALAAYPALSCTGTKVKIFPFGMGPGVNEDVFCPGKKETFKFIEGVLTEISELFPSRYIHIGGDEVPKTRWKACPDCQKMIKQQGLKNEEELQSWFTKQVEKIVNAKGKKLIGWDEICEGGLNKTATVMFWRGNGDGTSSWPKDGLLGTILRANDAIMTPTSHCYFDYTYEAIPTKHVYGFQPVPGNVSKEASARLLGVQANFWSHIDRTEPRMDRQIFPRLLALAEVGWTDINKKDWNDFTTRLKGHYEALSLLKIKEVWIEPPSFSLKPLPSGDSVEIRMQRNDPVEAAIVHYTVDGTAPVLTSSVCTESMRLAMPLTFRAGMFYAGTMMGGEKSFAVTEAFQAPVQLKVQPSEKYKGSAGTLTDGILGTTSLGSGAWIGYEGNDCEAILDLGRPHQIRELSLGYLEDSFAWIFAPAEITFEVSRNGKEFTAVDSWKSDPNAWGGPAKVGRYSKAIQPTEARYVRVTAKNRGICPPNHAGNGARAWIFLDEILVR